MGAHFQMMYQIALQKKNDICQPRIAGSGIMNPITQSRRRRASSVCCKQGENAQYRL